MATAVQSRGRVMGSLTVINKFLLTVTSETTCCDIEVRLNKLDDLWKEFQEHEAQVAAMLADNPNSTVELKQEEFEIKFFNTKSKLLELFRKKQPQIPQAVKEHSFDQLLDQQRIFLENLADRSQAINERSMIQTSEKFKLPHVTIDKFSGEFEAWPSFFDLYTTSVHNIDTISQVHKFQILKGLLRGPPLNIIRNFLVTDANYMEAWDKLVKRYDKKRPLLNSHISRFFDQPSASNGSFQTLRQISDTSDEIIRGIKALGQEAESRDPWLIRILLNKVDEETRIAWANRTLNQEFPKIEEFLQFLNDRCYAKESAIGDTRKKGAKISGVTVTSMHSASKVKKCPCCSREHHLWRCMQFKRMTSENRQRIVNCSGVCHNCLRAGHDVSKCPIEYSCRICHKKHSTLLHQAIGSVTPKQSSAVSAVLQTDTATSESHQSAAEIQPSFNSNAITTVFNVRTSRLAILPTALIYVYDTAGNCHLARALLDSGSQSTFVSETLVQKLKLRRLFSTVQVSGISETKGEISKGNVQLTIQSRYEPSECFKIEALILNKLTSSIPQSKIEAQWIEEINEQNLQLADPAYHTPSKIDILLGADIFFEVLRADRFKFKTRLIAQSTKFGWVISGAVPGEKITSSSFTITIQEDDTNQLLERFWKLEEVPTTSVLSEAELACERHFTETHLRKSDGRYVVRLPFKEDSGELGHSKSAAMNRLIAMERKFNRFPDLHEQYRKFMDEYVSLGHMTETKPSDPTSHERDSFYLPHHAVLKSDSTTTKLRVVFDGSCKSTSGISLNNLLLVGPTIQKDLVSILMLFRKHAIAFSSDVEKMYRQIEVHQLDQNYQKILWRTATSESIRSFRLNTVTYGTSCAPFLAVRTLHQIANDHEATHPLGSQIAKRDFYVDDCLSGADSTSEAILAMQEVSEMLSKGGFNLRKWKSNSPELLSIIPPKFRESTNLEIDRNTGTVKTLGLQWNPTKDTFSYNINLRDSRVASKRDMLSQISRVFDPLGWVSPVIIVFKISLQKLWLQKIGWDDPLPVDIERKWQTSKSTLQELCELEIPRFLMTSKSTTSIQIHGFCDASEHAYAAVIYLRTTDSSTNTTTRIVISKTKVAPLKQVSLPRLELCGAVLLSRLHKYTVRALEFENIECYGWTDSKVVLAWLADVPRRWKCFIGNRTAEILANGPGVKWNHVASKHNPADLASRGVTPKQLAESELWWNGPAWLRKPRVEWPITTKLEATNLEERPVSLMGCLNVQNQVIQQLCIRIESYSKIKRILVRILRWRKIHRNLNPVDILRKAEVVCVRWAQAEEFHDEMKSLKQSKTVGTRSRIISLSPFIDHEGILRVGGRLRHAHASFSVKHPIILPKKHILNEKIIHETHRRYLHPGPTLQTSILRQKYWIINCRNAVRSYISKCIECKRQRAATSHQLMGNLPKARISPSRPFLYTGMDYAGPLYLKSRLGRGRIPIVKGYICIFICLATKAIHIELCQDMTAEAFIATLRRFVSRRGIPVEIMSDNGSNFVGAKRKLSELFHLYQQNYSNKLISDFLSQQEIKFSFNPASGPHFGGLWESGIKSIKHHITRVTKNTVMTTHEMETLLIQIEGLLNSRPLCPLTDDIDDLSVLTPAHFLIGEPITAIPEPSLDHIATNRLSRWQNVQVRVQGFWKQWAVNYLHTLQQRRKWTTKQPNINIGDLILVKDDNLPPSKWLMGRIIALHPGTDGLVRVASIKTTTGTLKRPIVKLCPLCSTDEATSLVAYLHVLKLEF